MRAATEVEWRRKRSGDATGVATEEVNFERILSENDLVPIEFGRSAIATKGSMMRRLLSVIVTFAFCMGAGAGDLEEGTLALNRGDYAAAISKFTKAAEQGDAVAQYNLGLMYHDGEGVPRDYKRAVYWYTKAAEQGNAAAQFWVGIMYRDSMGVARDYGEALYWLARSAARGNANAQFTLGQIYQNGEGYPIDDVQAYVWFKLAGSQGDRDAKVMLDKLEKRMTPEQVAEAQRLAREWEPR